MLPLSGWSKPAISRRQVVLPDPDGPSSAKNSPGAIDSDTESSATTGPKARRVARSSIAGVMSVAGRRATPRGAPRNIPLLRSAAAHHGDIVRRPAAVGHAGALAAGRLRRAPEV